VFPVRLPLARRAALLAATAAGACAGDPGADPELDADFDPAYVEQQVATAGAWSMPANVHAIAQTQGVAYDDAPPWDGGAHCSGTFFSGTRKLGDYLRQYFPQVTSYGGYDCRPNTANTAQTSMHGTGRAIDVFIPTTGGDADNTKGDAVGNWLATHAERIGVQLIIWDHSVWQASLSGEKLRAYGGPIPHIDHLHVELTVEGAREQTSWFRDGGLGQPPGGGRPDYYVLTGDWDGDGTKTPGFYNIRTHRWILSNHNSGGGVDYDFGWGGDGYLPVVGDWDGDGSDSPGLYNPITHHWVLSNHNSGGGVDYDFGWGGDGGVPLAGDWDGDGKDTIGLYYPATHAWRLANHNSGGGIDYDFGWGGDGFVPLVGDWNGDGSDSPGLYSISAHRWVLSNHNSGGGVDADFGWGGGAKLPIVGDWNDDRSDTPGLFQDAVFTLSNFNAPHGVDATFGWGPNAEFTVVGVP
jgi:hypothetical protein